MAFSARPVDREGNDLSGREITWFSESSFVATVTQSGEVEAVSVGTSRIFAESEGVMHHALVTVRPIPVAEVLISPDSMLLEEGESAEFSASVLGTEGRILEGREIEWSSSDEDIALVSGEGRITAISAGRATVTAESEGVSASAVLTVIPVPVAEVRISPASLSLEAGESGAFNAALLDSNGNPLAGRLVEWSSSAPAVADVNADGQVVAHSEGTATITAEAEGQTASADVTVAPVRVATISVAPEHSTLRTGQTQTFSATLLDSRGSELTDREIAWTSSDESIAQVNSGRVTAISSGQATITAESGGVSGTAQVCVLSDGRIGRAYEARNGLSITLDAVSQTDLGNGYTRISITYTQRNNTDRSIDEGTLRLYLVDASPMAQFGAFGSVLPGPAHTVTRTYSFDVHRDDEPLLLQFDHNHFFAAEPIPGAVHWFFPIR